jgi:hypothetical protein
MRFGCEDFVFVGIGGCLVSMRRSLGEKIALLTDGR